MEKFYSIWRHTFLFEDSDELHCKIIQGSKTFTSLFNSKIPPQQRLLTVVLYGGAGVGKTTLAKKWMLDWTQSGFPKMHDSTDLPTTCDSAFYLSCKELSRQGACTFAELLAKKCPDVQEARPQILAQGQKILVVIDGLDELIVPSGSLIHDICGDWKKQKPVPVLLGSLLKRKLLPKATLLVTTRPAALRELRLLVDQPLFIEVEGLLEPDRRAYFLRHFEKHDQALRAFQVMKSSPALFPMGSAPAVCWVVCTCLKGQMEKGKDPTPTCQTTTSMFLRFLCGQFLPQPPGSGSPGQHLGQSLPGTVPDQHLPASGPGQHFRQRFAASLSALCLLATQGIWAQTSVFDRGDLTRLGVEESDLRPFLDKNILQVDTDCEDCYTFLHLSVQQFLAAAFYVLGGEAQGAGAGHGQGIIRDARALLSKEARLKNPNLTPVAYFLFGLANEERARELEATFGSRVSLGVRKELLRSLSGGNRTFSSRTDTKEALCCLYESQEEPLVTEAMAHVTEMSLHLQDQTDLVHSSFCLKHCRSLRRLSLQVERGLFLENDGDSKWDTWAERSQHDHHALCLWMDLCSVLSLNENLSFLDVSQSFLSPSSVRILCEQITRVTCSLQKVVIKNVSPVDAYRDFCLAFIGKKTLTHLILEGSVPCDPMLLMLLCEALKHQRCNLQYVRLGSWSDFTQQWDDLFSALEINQSLQYLDLTGSELRDEGAKLLCTSLRHLKCFLQWLSLEDCHLTEACCKELSSALIVNRRLTHLCLAKNDLGDGGVRLLCEGLSYPECQLQTLVLRQCNITRHGCQHISDLLQGDSSLTHLDLGFNPIATGVWFLCEALKKPNCNLKCLGLCGCSLSSFCCENLASALASNQRLEALDLGQNSLGQSGVTTLFEALKQSPGTLKTLRLRTDEASAQTQKLLKEVRDGNPNLTIDCKAAPVARASYCDFLF